MPTEQTVTVPDGKVLIPMFVPIGTTTRIADAIAIEHQYDRRKLDGETKAQFAQRITKLWWRNTVLAVEARAAEQSAGDAVRNNLSDPLVSDV